MPDDSDIDAAWRVNPLEAKPAAANPPPEPAAPPPQATPRPAPLIPQMDPRGRAASVPEPEAAAPEPAAEEGEAPAEEEAAPAPAPSGSPGVTAALFVAMLLGGGLVWRFTAPRRLYARGLGLLIEAQRTGDPKTAAAALAAFKSYVDAQGQGYDRLFQAAALAGDEASGAAYEARLMKAAPTAGSALLVWYEGALTYHALAVRMERDALDAAQDPAARQELAAKIRAHCEAAAALKPTRARAVEDFESGFPQADAQRLLRIDAMQNELAVVDAAKLLEQAEKPKAPAAPPVAAASSATAVPPAVSSGTAHRSP